MTDKIVDITSAREAKEQKGETYASDMERGSRRHHLLANAIHQMKVFSSEAEIAKTLRAAADILEKRE